MIFLLIDSVVLLYLFYSMLSVTVLFSSDQCNKRMWHGRPTLFLQVWTSAKKNTVASKPLPVLLAFIVAISLCCIRVKFFAFLGNYRDYHGIIQSSTVVSYFNIVAYFDH